MRGIVIAGTHSGSGKTTVTLGLMAALRKNGLTVQPFKAGPDFIDAGLHRLAAERVSRNLDLWMCGPEYVKQCFVRHGAGSDICVVEGVMGLYDGDRSTASLAGLLQVPVVLVIDAYGMAESAGAVVKGFVEFGIRNAECGMRFAGVIFNRVASESHYQRLKKSVLDMPVLGYLPRELDFEIPHRHLGLTVAEERPFADASLGKLADTVLKLINVDLLYESAGLSANRRELNQKERATKSASCNPQSAIRIAVAYDKAFSFYYEDNLDLLRDAGAEIVLFSPLADEGLPGNVDAVYIGGGYPELHADALSRNEAMRAAVRAWAEAGEPIYAECGGLMYLSQSIRSADGGIYPMTGVLPFGTTMLKKPKLGYREVQLGEDCLVGKKGGVCRGHEFHYSEIAEIRDDNEIELIFDVRDGQGGGKGKEGFRYKNTLASYVHLHFGSNEWIAGSIAAYIKGEGIA